MLPVKAAPEFWTCFEGAPDERKAFREAITGELPAFAHYLISMSVPPALLGRRFGLKSFIPEEISQTMFQDEPEHLLSLLIEQRFFPQDGSGIEKWEGSAEDLKQALCADDFPGRNSAQRLLGAHAVVCGQLLHRLEQEFPARFQRGHRTASKREWIIRPPLTG